MTTTRVYLIKRLPVEIEVDRDDVISLSTAARLSGRSLAAIGGLLDSGTLPTYQFVIDGVAGSRVQRFTSRRAVISLPPRRIRQRRVTEQPVEQ